MARALGIGLGVAGLLCVPLASEMRIMRAAQPLTDAWKSVGIEPRGATLLGLSFRPRQAEALGLDLQRTLQTLLGYPFQMIRLGAYWNRIETAPGVFDTTELDWQVEAAGLAGKQIVLCVGALKTFGYPEFFAPSHYLGNGLPERTRIHPSEFASLLAAGTDFISRIVDRYKNYSGVVAWQVEHEAVDPLGMEHSWRLDSAFVAREVAAVRQSDPGRPILMNGYLPTSLLVGLTQWWQTRDQGDSLAVAQQLADIVGIDYYPRHALVGFGGTTLYLDGSRSPWQQRRLSELFEWARLSEKRLMISEGQAEPWEAVTTPPNPPGLGMYSCRPENVIENYNRCLGWARQAGFSLDAYLFWGAEYWALRAQHGDPSYMQAFARILDTA